VFDLDPAELRELYQEMIQDHSAHPRNFRKLMHASAVALGHNPLCGDRIEVYVDVDPDGVTVRDVAFQGKGCAISQASASLMTATVKGKPREEVERLFETFHRMVTGAGGEGGEGAEGVDPEALGKLIVFSGVREFPIRVKCASLAWHTLRAALRGEQEAVSTE